VTKNRRIAIDAWLKAYFADPTRTADYETSRNHRRTIVERDAQGLRITTIRFPGVKDKKMNKIPRGQKHVWNATILCATHRKRIRSVLGSPGHYPADRFAYESASKS
jgi:hypothetical protein